MPTASQQADVLVVGETIAAIGRDLRATLSSQAVDHVIDADRPATSSPARSTSTRTWSCRSAARSPRTRSRRGRARPRSAGRRRSSTSRSSRGASRCARASTRGTPRPRATRSIDYGFHMIMTDVNDDTWPRWTRLVEEGVTDFKLFTAYPGVFYSDDGAIFRAMQRTGRNGGLIMMHAENGHGDRRRRGRAGRRRARPTPTTTASPATRSSRARRRTASSGWPRRRACRSTSSISRRATRWTRCAQRPRPRHAGLRRDVPAVPVPLAGRHGQRLQRRQVRLLAPAAPGRPPGRRSGRAWSRTTCRWSRPTTARSTSTTRSSSASATSGRSPTGCPGSRIGST